jgi:hypothetical protein
VFFNPGEVIRSAPLGRQACRFHPDARTIHSIIRLRPNAKQKYPESLSEIQDHLKTTNSDSFNCVKVLIVSEAFMCNSPHLEALLVHIKNVSPCCIFLFDGDCLQLAMKATPNYPASPFLTRDRFQEVCPNTQIIVFEKCMKYRIRNAVKLAHMEKMRLGVAQQDTIDYLKKAIIPKEHHPVLRVFANARPAAEFNETQLNLILGKSKSLTVTVLQAKDFWTDSKFPTKMSTNEEHSLSVDDNIKVVQGAPILIVQNHLAEKCFGQQQGQKLHVGNGTTGFFREYDRETDSIIVDVEFADKKEYVRMKRWNFCTETKTRSQFPIMLAWAATIQKVQGMEFKSLEVDFCLNYYAIPSSGSSDFFQGCAYMVFTRAETVVVIGDITLPLLNNVNSWCLQWWKLQVSLWNDFKKGQLTQKSLLFRNAIHQHNWHAAQLQKIANDRKQANSSASVTAPTLALVPTIPASASASAPAPAPASASASSSALTTAPAPAPPNKRQAPALDFDPPLISASTSASQQQQPNEQTLVVEEDSFEVDWDIDDRDSAYQYQVTLADDLVPVPVSFNPAALPSLRPAGAQASAPALAPTLAHVPASAPAPAPLTAPSPASDPDKAEAEAKAKATAAEAKANAEAGAKARGFTPAPAPVFAPASFPAPACALTHLVDDDVPPHASVCALTSASAQPPAHKRPYGATVRHTAFTLQFANALASAPAPPQPDAHKRQAPPPNPQCPPSVFPATMTFSSTKKRKTFPTIKKVGDLIEVSS